MKRQSRHILYYFLEALFLFFGFFAVSFFSYNFTLQLGLLTLLLGGYIALGFIHHAAQHDIRAKIMVEYVLVSLLILAVFIFLHSGRI